LIEMLSGVHGACNLTAHLRAPGATRRPKPISTKSKDIGARRICAATTSSITLY